MDRVDVAVVGGGIAGLATAYELHRRRVTFRLFEAAPRLGGVILTERIDGFTIDAGPDALLVQKPAAIDLCRELGLGDRLVPTLTPRTAFILRSGILHPLPEASVLGIPTRMAPFLTTRLFSPAGKLRVSLDLVLRRRRLGPTDDESIGDFFRRRFGRESVEYLAEPLLAGIHAGDVDRLSMRALFPRLVEAEQRYGSLIRAFRRLSSHRSPDGVFRSLPGGLEELSTALVAALPADALHCHTRVTSLAGRAPYTIHTEGHADVTAGAVVLAVPSTRVAALVAPFDADLAALCRAIPHASTATVALAYPRAAVQHPLLGSGFVVPRVERSTTIIAASWVSSKWPARAPAGQVLLRAFIGGARDRDALDRDTDELGRVAHADLAAILGIHSQPSLTRVYRWIDRSPQHEVGHLSHLDRIDGALSRWPGLYVAGSSFRSVGIPDCIADGRAVAAAAAAHVEGQTI